MDSNPSVGAAGILYSGERIDIIIEKLRKADVETSTIIISLDHENMRFPNLALTPTQAFPIRPSVNKDIQEGSKSRLAGNHQENSPGVRKLDLQTLAGSKIFPINMPTMADSTFVLYSTVSYLAINDNRPRGYINNTAWPLEQSNGLPLLATGLHRTGWPSNSKHFIPAVHNAEWIDVVLNNLDDKGHPFHLHGNDFYVLASHTPSRVGAYELYNPFDKSKGPAGGPLNLRNPLVKDTVYVPSMGYVVIRFKGDNPGLWFFHCHILWHQSVGMAMAFEVSGQAESIDWKKLIAGSRKSCRSLD